MTQYRIGPQPIATCRITRTNWYCCETCTCFPNGNKRSYPLNQHKTTGTKLIRNNANMAIVLVFFHIFLRTFLLTFVDKSCILLCFLEC